jgi:hypothetical protein
MPNTFFALGKARKVKIFLLNFDNYYDVQSPKVDNKVAIMVKFLKNHVLECWTYKNVQEPTVVENLTWVAVKELFIKRFIAKHKELCFGTELGTNKVHHGF